MKSRSIKEWLEWRKEHGAEEVGELPPNALIDYHPEYGFIAYEIDKDRETLVNICTCGDGKYWARVYKDIMKLYGLKKLELYTEYKNPKVWERRFGFRIKGYLMEVGVDELKVD